MIPRRSLLLALALAVAPLAAPPAAAADTVVFAAASLKDALDDVTARYLNATGKTVTVSYAASSALARQIEAGAPADIFFSADLDWMDYVATRNLIRPATRVSLLGNALVLVAPQTSMASIALTKGADLTPLLGADGRVAMANVDSVPAGRYGKAALEWLGAWDKLAPRVVQADNVRAALAFVTRGETPLGIVYRTDTVAEPAVRVVAAFPPDSHPPIIYPVAQLSDSTSPDAAAFLAFLRGEAARAAFAAQGFTVLVPAG